MSAVWIIAIVAAGIWLLTLRASVRLVSRELDNGWDNALGYGVVSALVVSMALSLLGAGWLAIFIPVVVAIAQTVALGLIYEVRPFRAVLLGLVHTALFTTASLVTAMISTVVAIYLLYGKIITDPWVILRIILRWLGYDWPF